MDLQPCNADIDTTAPFQATRNTQTPAVPIDLLGAVTEATETLKAVQGPIVDQYAHESRIH